MARLTYMYAALLVFIHCHGHCDFMAVNNNRLFRFEQPLMTGVNYQHIIAITVSASTLIYVVYGELISSTIVWFIHVKVEITKNNKSRWKDTVRVMEVCKIIHEMFNCDTVF